MRPDFPGTAEHRLAEAAVRAFSSIKSRVVAVASAIVVLGIWALALRVTATLQDDLRALVAVQLESTAAYVAGDLDRGLQLRIATLREIAAGIPAEAVADPAEAQRLLERSRFSLSLFSAGFALANAQGVYVADFPRVAGRAGGSIADRRYFRDALRGADLAISEPLVGRFLQRPVVSFAVPVRDATGVVAGVLVHSISPADSDLFGPLAGSRIGRSGELLALSARDRTIVAATDPARVMQPVPPKGANVLLDRRIEEGFDGAGVTVDSQGREMLGVARRLKSTGWIVVATISTSEAYAPIENLERQIYVAALLLSLGVALILRALLARQLAPLEEAGAAIGRMTGGAEALAPLPVRRDDEVGTLLRSFNRLAEDRLRAEDARRAAGDRLAKVFRNSPAAITVVRLDPPTVLDINDAYERQFGWTRAEVLGRDPGDLNIWIDATDRARFRGLIASEGRVSGYVSRARRRNGEIIDTLNSAEIIEEGGERLALVIVLDISEQMRAERALRESEQRIRALVELSSDWYWQTDAGHRFTRREGAVLGRMGLPADADLGRTRWEIGYPNMTEDGWREHRDALARREEFRDLLLERVSPDGRHHWATISGRPLFDDAGAFLGYHGTGRDVTAQIEAQQALQQLNADLERKVAERTAELAAANRELEAFAYSVSHDLRTPLRGIDGFSQVLLDQHAGQLDADAQRLLGRIRAAAQRMGRLITDLLALSKVTRSVVQPQEVDLSALAAQVAEDLAPEAQGRRVEWRIAPGLRARGDAGLLRVVLANLLGNALKYSRDASPAIIEFGAGRAMGDRIEFFVRDNGAGFDMAYRDRLFEPFQRLHGTHEFEGSGVGLATVQRVIAKHGGEVDAEGTPGAGATFRFTLPA